MTKNETSIFYNPKINSMKVKIWGCRGSIPTPGKETLKYGGESTCVEVISRSGEIIIIDCGSGIRKLGKELIKDKSIDHVRLMLTHSHWDHLSGFPFFVPAFVPRFSISLCGGPISQDVLMKYLNHQMEPPYFPVDFSAIKADFSVGCSCGLGFCDHNLKGVDKTMACHSIPLNHPNGGYGFKFIQDNKVFVFLTDNEIRFAHEGGLSREDYVEFCRGADLLFHDAQFTEEEYIKRKSWGHSTYLDAIQIGIEAGVKSLGLFHHDPDHDDDFIDNQVRIWQDYIKNSGSKMECFACADGMELNV